ncbi:hypothetical protein BJY01DRAFT_53323 [Aspergillus pseudoustus]|uniref:Uncharacterized protein n=1 Tax=Aspergillus pseudoustus TaxID=1810923 RepID=A0ABR4J9T8_9EURO
MYQPRRTVVSGYLLLPPVVLHAFDVENPHMGSRISVSSFNNKPVASQRTGSPIVWTNDDRDAAWLGHTIDKSEDPLTCQAYYLHDRLGARFPIQAICLVRLDEHKRTCREKDLLPKESSLFVFWGERTDSQESRLTLR